MALGGAAITLLDAATTVVVSAATASSYLSSEVHPSFPPFVITILLLLGFAILCLSGTRDSARMACGILGLHVRHRISLSGLRTHASVGHYHDHSYGGCGCSLGSPRERTTEKQLAFWRSRVSRARHLSNIQRRLHRLSRAFGI